MAAAAAAQRGERVAEVPRVQGVRPVALHEDEVQLADADRVALHRALPWQPGRDVRARRGTVRAETQGSTRSNSKKKNVQETPRGQGKELLDRPDQ